MRGFSPPPDVMVFLGRLTHLDSAAVVRLRPAGPARTALWARLPWGVLVTREVDAEVGDDRTVDAAELLGRPDPAPEEPSARRDVGWRWPLPPHPGAVVEELPAQRLRDVAAAAAGTLREVTAAGLDGRRVGARVLREALLDHVAVVVETDGGVRVEVPQRLVQAVVRMGFLGRSEVPVRVRLADRWVGLAARYGTAWLPPPDPLRLRPVRPR
jgi:hypothetical protein